MGGTDPQLIEGDSFRMIIATPEFGDNPAKQIKIVDADKPQKPIIDQSGAESGAEKILLLLQKEPLAKSNIADQLGLNTVTGALNRLVKDLHKKGLVEYTIPDKPNSRLQKYRLTEKGKNYLRNHQ
ncbi:MAG: hypothetical protein U9P07_03100 [Pseudomonadota bacterium]|nr:hypothetical protein [Pseudomonadota bacterium]